MCMHISICAAVEMGERYRVWVGQHRVVTSDGVGRQPVCNVHMYMCMYMCMYMRMCVGHHGVHVCARARAHWGGLGVVVKNGREARVKCEYRCE